MRQDDRDNDLDAEDRALIAKLEKLPPEGSEPDWQALEAAIRAEVGDEAPRPWWRNWRWIVPVWALATTAVIAFVILRSDKPILDGAHERTATVPTRLDAGVVAPAAPAREVMWLDGEAVEIGDVDGSALDEIDGQARAALAPEGDVTGGILPVADYGWIDALDDDALVAAEDWLNRKRS
jgi:hypothetical protein